MRRWLAGTAIVVTAIGAYWLTREDASPPAAQPAAVTAAAPQRQARELQVRRAPAPARGEPQRHFIEKPHDPFPEIKKWKVDGLPGTFREVANADDYDHRAEEAITYKRRRLRFRLTDAAATCYDGGDGKEQISFGYTMVVQSGQMWLENVRVLHSNLSDRELEQCILSSIQGLRTSAQGIPDLRKEQQTAISQHDMFVRNRGA